MGVVGRDLRWSIRLHFFFFFWSYSPKQLLLPVVSVLPILTISFLFSTEPSKVYSQ